MTSREVRTGPTGERDDHEEAGDHSHAGTAIRLCFRDLTSYTTTPDRASPRIATTWARSLEMCVNGEVSPYSCSVGSVSTIGADELARDEVLDEQQVAVEVVEQPLAMPELLEVLVDLGTLADEAARRAGARVEDPPAHRHRRDLFEHHERVAHEPRAIEPELLARRGQPDRGDHLLGLAVEQR